MVLWAVQQTVTTIRLPQKRFHNSDGALRFYAKISLNMKKFFFLLAVILLCSCSATIHDPDSLLDDFENGYVFRGTNVTGKYFSYYLPSDMYRFQSEQTGAVIEYNDSSILISLNIAGLLSREGAEMPLSLESGFYPEANLVFNREGDFINRGGQREPYLCSIYRFDGRDLIVLRTQGFKIYSFTNEQEQSDVLRHMLLLGKNAVYSHELIREDFSDTISIDYQKKQVDLFDIIIPKNGHLSDMIIDDSGKNTTEETQSSDSEQENKGEDLGHEEVD